jgi:hypothetical protein
MAGQNGSMFLAMMLAMMFACEHGLAIVLAVSQQQ